MTTPVQYLKGVGPYLASLLEKIGVKTLEDLFYHLPHRYLDRQNLLNIREAGPGAEVVVCAELLISGESSLGRTRKKMFEAIFSDGTGQIHCKWFRFYKSMPKAFQKGKWAILSGKLEIYRGEKQIAHPEIEWLGEGEEQGEGASRHQGIVPVYPLTEGLHPRTLRKVIQNALQQHLAHLSETLPESILQKYKLPAYNLSFKEIHTPETGSDLSLLNEGRSFFHKRLIFDEFFFLEMGLALKRHGTLREEGVPLLKDFENLKKFKQQLPFSLTQGQEKALEEIVTDLSKPHPMNRLLQGDVGSGKTAVAAGALWMAVSQGYQACLMAPTEILAEQHLKTMQRFLGPMGVSITLLKSDLSGAEKKERYEKIKRGEIQLVIGTHALLQQGVEFHSLVLSIIDEQHRFGVMQRAQLKQKGKNPHLLIMTATPIPRTLALTVYGDLETSILNELPAGRMPIVTRSVHSKDLEKLYQFMRQEIQKGRQAYVVYPLIEESETLDVKNAVQMYEKFKSEIFPDLPLGLLHGQMKGEEKEKIIQEFIQKKIQILITTTVIEVGVDVPNATLMIIENAERFGLSQLHQLRGRVGRGSEKSYCFLLAGFAQGEKSRERLKVLCETTDGFKIAEADLNLRGPGDFVGVRQAGLPDFRIANIVRDGKILEAARKEAFEWIAQDPELQSSESQKLKLILSHRWKNRLNLIQTG